MRRFDQGISEIAKLPLAVVSWNCEGFSATLEVASAPIQRCMSSLRKSSRGGRNRRAASSERDARSSSKAGGETGS